MKNLGAGKSSKKIMKHAMNPALRGQAELMGQVVQYLAEIKVTPFQLKNLLLLYYPLHKYKQKKVLV